MADFGTPVADQIAYNPATALQNVSALLGIQQQQQALTQQKANIQAAQAQAQQQQQTAQQRAGIASYMKDHLMDHIDPQTGILDLNSALSDKALTSVAGDQLPEVASSLIGVRQHQLDSQQALVNLNDSVRNQFNNIMGGLRNDPDVLADNQVGRNKVQQAVDSFGKTGPDAQRIADIYGPIVEHAPQGKLAPGLAVAQLQGMSAGQQANAQAPGYADTGTGLVQINPLAAGGSAYGKLTGQGYIPKDIAGVQTATTQAQTDNATANSAIQGANNAPLTKNILQNMKSLTYTTATGPGQTQIANAEAFLGQHVPGLSGAADDATKYQVLNKYAHQLAIQYAGQNYGTDAGRDLVQHSLPDPENMTPQALRQTIGFIDGQVQLSQARGALANAYKRAHNGSTSGYQQMDSEFMQNVDPRMFDYIGLKDKASQQSWIKQTFGDDKAGIADFARKMQVIQGLGGFDYLQGQK